MFDKEKYTKFNDAQLGSVLERPVLVSDIVENMSKGPQPKPFVKFTLKDGFTAVNAVMFDCTAAFLADNGIAKNTVADVRMSVGEYQGAKNFKMMNIAPCADTQIVPEDFVKLPPVQLDVMFDEICALIRDSAKPEHDGKKPIAVLALKILSERRNEYMFSSAAVSMHHNLRGGLIYHSYRMVKAADVLCGVYSILDRELMICGAALHDLGKIWEYSTSEAGDASFTREGVLYGHLYMGGEYVRSVAGRDNCYDFERVSMLVHMILSHHGTQEWGAVSCPAVPEALALHYIDNLDAKLYMFEEAYETLKGGEITPQKNKALDNNIYKPAYLGNGQDS